MKIAMFADCWHPVVNGVVTSIHVLRTALQSQGHDVHLYVPAKTGYRDSDPAVHRFFSVTLPFHQESRFALWHPWTHVFRLMRQRPDIIHIHTPFALGVLGQWMSVQLSVPFVFTHHTLWEEYVHYVPLVNRRILRRMAVQVARTICNRSQEVIAPSEDVRDRLLEQGVRRPITVIPTGVDMEEFRGGDPQRVRQMLNLPPDALVALYAGRLGKEKSLEFLLRAFARTAQDVPTARLVLVGGGPERGPLENLAAEMGLRDRILFTGYVPRAHLADFFKLARVFLFASVTETQGLVSLEAQAAGCPVVAVRASGSSEAVDDGRTGFLVERDECVFANHATRLLTDESMRASMSAAALERAWTFSSQSMATRTVAVYGEAIRTGARRRMRFLRR